jgi:hypothetical protein
LQNAHTHTQIMTTAVGPKSHPGAKRDPAAARQRSALCEAVLVAALAGLPPLAKRAAAGGGGASAAGPVRCVRCEDHCVRPA